MSMAERVELEYDDEGRPVKLSVDGLPIPGVRGTAVEYLAGHPYAIVRVELLVKRFVQRGRS